MMKLACRTLALIILLGLFLSVVFLSAQTLAASGDDRAINIIALQAGTKHSEKGNPGLQENFRVFEKLVIQASAAKPAPDLICFPEHAISGWEYPSKQIINGIAEQILRLYIGDDMQQVIPVRQQNVRNVKAYSILTNEDTRPSWTAVFMDSKGKSQTKLGIDKTVFTLNGKPAFLYGISYYGALDAQESFVKKDLADIKKNGFNWVRIWANWPGSTGDISAIDDYGNPVEHYMKKLKWIVQECDKAGIVIDVTLAHSNNTDGRSLKTTEAHEHAVRSIVTALKSYQNWYLDLANERDVGDSRFVSFKDLKQMRETAKALYPDLHITASAGNDISRDDLDAYINMVGVDFIAPHRPRTSESASETAAKTSEYLAWMKSLGRIVPVHYQEPFRRGYSNWQPVMKDYITDLFGAKKAGAAGWCFHNGDQRGGTHQPGRSFDLHEKRLFDQLDPEELLTIHTLAARMR